MIKEGSKAPSFKAQDQHGNSVSLADYKGEKILLYFYPKDDTPGCTAQACNLRDNLDPLHKKGYRVIGVSPDKVEKHRKFADKYQLNFPLLADPEKEIISAYGVWGKKKFMGREFDGVLRTTFLIDEKGIIERVIEKVKTKDHAAQVTDSA